MDLISKIYYFEINVQQVRESLAGPHFCVQNTYKIYIQKRPKHIKNRTIDIKRCKHAGNVKKRSKHKRMKIEESA